MESAHLPTCVGLASRFVNQVILERFGPHGMRLATWNCCSGPFREKEARFAAFGANVCVIPECPEIPPEIGFWMGTNSRKGLAAFVSPEYELQVVELANPLSRYVVPIQVRGAHDFLLIAVWAMADRPERYVRGLCQAILACRSIIESQPTVIMGDFNSNTIWDSSFPQDRNHSALVSMLGEHGLKSCYHRFFEEEQGVEAQPTFYLYRHPDRPYHIDYCFVPETWKITHVEVGSHREWSSYSDHSPMIVDVEPLPE